MNRFGSLVVWLFGGLVGCLVGAILFTSCSKEPDESDLYTFTGQTIEDFIQADSTLTSYHYILTRVRYDRTFAAYGQYTAFAPSNEAVDEYIDSIYNDTVSALPHNGMTELSLQGLTDSLCLEMVKYHTTAGLHTITDLSTGDAVTTNTLLGRPFTSSVDSLGRTVINSSAVILDRNDNEVTNGLVFRLNKVIPRSSRLLYDDIFNQGDFKIFAEALQRTGLKDSLTKTDRGITYDMKGTNLTNGGDLLYYPTECKYGFTVFAETDKVFKNAGINSFDDLVKYCKEWYGNCAGSDGWYDYAMEKGITISTDDDYTNRFNVVNIFMAYHILRASMAIDKMVYEKKSNNENWNYAFGAEPFDYFETMLPHTLVKIWQPLYHNTGGSQNLWINRYRANNTVTDEVGTMGSEAMHPLKDPGVQIERNAAASLTSYNGYVHRIKSILLYDRHVPKGVLAERLRFDCVAMLDEMMNNGIRGTDINTIGLLNQYGSNGSYIAYPLDYFEHMHSYNTTTHILSCAVGAWRCWESDQLQGWGQFDFAIRIPPVPTGVYELRIDFPAISYGGMMQFYVGTSKKASSMRAMGIPFDLRTNPYLYGYTKSDEEQDWGIESDTKMRNNGYMRAPCSFSRGTLNSITSPVTDPSMITGSTNCRTEGTATESTHYNVMVRRIIGTMQLKQSEEYWIRIKSLINDDPSLKWFLDFIELVPTSVVSSQNYSEDWY